MTRRKGFICLAVVMFCAGIYALYMLRFVAMVLCFVAVLLWLNSYRKEKKRDSK